MAKEKFYRTKPNVNAGTIMRLAQNGFSTVGARQIAFGEIISDPQDRILLAEVLTTASGPWSAYKPITIRKRIDMSTPSGQATGKRQHKPFRVRTYYDVSVFLKLGFSAFGAQQIAMVGMVTDSQDRELLAAILMGGENDTSS